MSGIGEDPEFFTCILFKMCLFCFDRQRCLKLKSLSVVVENKAMRLYNCLYCIFTDMLMTCIN